jgi:capsular polysaccharide biosynthesis protein
MGLFRRTADNWRARLRTIDESTADGAVWHRATAAEPYPLPAPQQFGERAVPVEQFFETPMPERGVVEVPAATIVGSGGWVLDAAGRGLHELTWFGSRADLITDPEAPPLPDRRARRRRGTALVLMSTWGEHYGHFVPDALGRLAVVRAAGIDLDQVDTIVVPDHRSAEGDRVLRRLGLDDDRLVRLARGEQVRADRVLAPTLPGLRRQYLPMVPRLFRASLGDPAPGSRRLLVVRRGYEREPVEQAAIERLALDRGFELYDPMQSADQAADFAAAAVVVGVSGSALTGLVHCAPGTAVVELFSDAHLYGYYCSLAAAGDLRYGAVIGRSDDGPRDMGPSAAPFSLDLDAVTAALDWAVA